MDHPFFTQDTPDLDGCEEDDWWFDDGHVHALVTITGPEIRIHDLAVNERHLSGARTGAGRAAMNALRPLFERIVIDGALHPFHDGGDDKPLLFWQAMLEEGLIDVMILSNCSVEITRDHLNGAVATAFGEVDLPYRPRPATRPGW